METIKKESDRNDKWKYNFKTEKFRLNNRKLKKKIYWVGKQRP